MVCPLGIYQSIIMMINIVIISELYAYVIIKKFLQLVIGLAIFVRFFTIVKRQNGTS